MKKTATAVAISFLLWLSGQQAVSAANEPYFLVTSGNSHSVLLYNEYGEFIETFIPFASAAPLRNPRGVVVGPDGNLYVGRRKGGRNLFGLSEVFVTALKQAGFFVRTVIVPGAPHFWMWEPIDEPTSYTGFLAPRLLRFLQNQLSSHR